MGNTKVSGKPPATPPPTVEEVDDVEVPLSDHPFVSAVVALMEHLKGEPKDGIMQPLYQAVKVEYRKLVGAPEIIPDHVQEAERKAKADADNPPPPDPGDVAKKEREAATKVPHGSVGKPN